MRLSAILNQFMAIKRLFFYVTRWWVIALVVLGVAGYVWLSREETFSYESELVERRDVVSVVSAVGVVEAPESVALSFEIAGTVVEVLAREGDMVERGDPLIVLDTALRESDVAAARARLVAEEARLAELSAGVTAQDREAAQRTFEAAEVALENALRTREDVALREDIAVANAYESLLTSGLLALRVDDAQEDTFYSSAPPTISGTYRGGTPGTYTISLYRSASESGYSFRVSGLEEGIVGEVSTVQPRPLGTKGLMIIFPDNFVRGSQVTWEVEIPNTRASTYVANKQAYERALELRDIALREVDRQIESARAARDTARANLDLRVADTRSERIAVAEAAVAQARAGLLAAETELDKYILRAPFGGILDTLTPRVGQTVSPHTPVARLVSDSLFEIVVRVPEADIADLTIGDEAIISFDAFPDAEYRGRVVSVARSAEQSGGVATFKTIIHLTEGDTARVREGLTADVDITATRREGVVAIPGRAVVRTEGRSVVRVVVDEHIEERPVAVGLRGSDGRVEIREGLSEEERIVTFIDSDTLAQLLN